uniref:Uncharacterized protein n=1 Tax=Megaviridae environmental sample TaxID=1737588 RepID=A0A5J6VI35_9VIRU|nr:MAG: hypothetical protein [Megaviridae environmental sample]
MQRSLLHPKDYVIDYKSTKFAKSVFKKHPFVISSNNEKINRGDFLVNDMVVKKHAYKKLVMDMAPLLEYVPFKTNLVRTIEVMNWCIIYIQKIWRGYIESKRYRNMYHMRKHNMHLKQIACELHSYTEKKNKILDNNNKLLTKNTELNAKLINTQDKFIKTSKDLTIACRKHVIDNIDLLFEKLNCEKLTNKVHFLEERVLKAENHYHITKQEAIYSETRFNEINEKLYSYMLECRQIPERNLTKHLRNGIILWKYCRNTRKYACEFSVSNNYILWKNPRKATPRKLQKRNCVAHVLSKKLLIRAPKRDYIFGVPKAWDVMGLTTIINYMISS